MSFSRTVLTVSLKVPILSAPPLDPLSGLFKFIPLRESSLFRHIWSLKWSLWYSLVPMDIAADSVWMGRLKGSHSSLSPHKTCPFLFHTQIYDPSITQWATTVAGIALYIKYPIPAKNCSIRATPLQPEWQVRLCMTSAQKYQERPLRTLTSNLWEKNKVYFYYFTCLCAIFLSFCLARPLEYYTIILYKKNLEFLIKLVIIWGGQNVFSFFFFFSLNMFTWVKTRLYNLFETQRFLYIAPSKELNCFMPEKLFACQLFLFSPHRNI